MKRPINVYVELDCLLDTRLGVLQNAYPDKYHAILANGYHERTCDDFEGIDKQEFTTRYNNRNLLDAAKSVMTPCFTLLDQILAVLLNDLPDDPEFSSVGIAVNTYPYYMEPEELDDLLVILRKHVNLTTDFSFIYVAPKDLTVSYVKREFIAMVMYDFSTWTECHYLQFGKVAALHDVTVFAPMLHPARNPTPQETEEVLNSELVKFEEEGYQRVNDVFDLYEILAMPFYTLRLLPVGYFSVIQPDFKEKYVNNPILRPSV